MSALGFAVALGLIVLVAVAMLVAGLVWAEREPLDDQTEHGDGEL